MIGKCKGCFKVSDVSNCASAALLFVRIVMGLAFVFHGWGKIQSPFYWMPPDAPIPGILQFLAALSEFGGGIALILGALVPLAMAGMAVTMLVATGMHAFAMNDPFVASGPGQSSYELALLYFALSLMFIAVGPGKYSVDAVVFGRR